MNCAVEANPVPDTIISVPISAVAGILTFDTGFCGVGSS